MGSETEWFLLFTVLLQEQELRSLVGNYRFIFQYTVMQNLLHSHGPLTRAGPVVQFSYH